MRTMSHDYAPSWDYPVIELQDVPDLTDRQRQLIAAAIEEFMDPATGQSRGLARAMGFEEIEIFFVEPLGLSTGQQINEGHGAVAIYCSGTSSRPVVGFDLVEMDLVCQEEGLSLAHEFRISVAHELAHAYQESLGMDHEHEQGFDEDDAESFARQWADTGVADLAMLSRQRVMAAPVERNA